MTDTPRTDALAAELEITVQTEICKCPQCRLHDLARKLERELVAANALIERLGEGLSHDGSWVKEALLEVFHEWQFNRPQRFL